MSTGPLLLLGAGEMAGEYARVLARVGAPFVVVGRGADRAAALGGEHDVPSFSGPTALADAPQAELAVVAVGLRELPGATLAAIERGCRRILVEKPGALASAELARVRDAAVTAGATVHVAFNRRFYPSVEAARAAAAEDGGVIACSFEFTEVERLVLAERELKGWSDEVLARWGVANSLHVIDLFLHLAGRPADWRHDVRGSLPWHPAGATYAGAGVTDSGALFAYLASWGGVGRWGVELVTARQRLVLRPLETLQVQHAGSFRLETIELPAEPEGSKPGLEAQVLAFLGGRYDGRLCPLEEAIAHVAVAEEMLGYA